ncbi:OmpA family protein [Candidatus Venteria ishoeyi]|uniref:OmpA family protein n=1 Tax=Candidatus Venteria ishoeyi TaxID=1899563 RepID=A0A1H6F919_9GAMM|nr:hypothetical protein [Candidatus Venteria ishoeyi]SEH05596.1 Uncharacterised protein [Candidatus Venteria ishoeyi]SEH07063.1 Uncharacterised protein [Candidatus Venteria ishoeyi]
MPVNFIKIYPLIWMFFLSLLLSACTVLSTKQEKTIVELEADVQSTLYRVREKVEINPDSALQGSISALDSILEYTDNVKSNPGKFSSDKINDYIHKINIINENMDRLSDLTLQMDISFPLGTYKLKNLAKKGQQKSNELVEKMIFSIHKLVEKYPEKAMKIMIKTTGYTDETGILPGSRLERELDKAMTAPVSRNIIKRRQQYNQMLSQFRANTLSQYVKQRLQQQLPTVYNVEIQTEIVGRGEQLPSQKKIHRPYKNTDSRRRICVISPFIEIVP